MKPTPKNQLFITLDSLRWDVFESAHVPNLRSFGEWKRAWTPGSYTLPAHMSFFVGKLPQTLDDSDYYDSVVTRFDEKGRQYRRLQLWRLSNPEAQRKAVMDLHGRNIVEGFAKKGYVTIGTGAMNWFNPRLPAGSYLTRPFKKFRFFDGPNYASHRSSEKQIDWALSMVHKYRNRRFFLFINFGETHHRFVYSGCPWDDGSNPYGNANECRRRQIACVEHLDAMIGALLSELPKCEIVICSDHGEAMGEDGLWGHGFVHPTVMEVPMLITHCVEHD